jgi:hypothetical protein
LNPWRQTSSEARIASQGGSIGEYLPLRLFAWTLDRQFMFVQSKTVLLKPSGEEGELSEIHAQAKGDPVLGCFAKKASPGDM